MFPEAAAHGRNATDRHRHRRRRHHDRHDPCGSSDGHFKIGKSATTPNNEAEGFIASAEDAADAWGISLEELFSGVNVVLYSGTGMLNTLLSRTGRKLGLITTKGLEDMILMGRGLQAWADYSYADRLHAVTHHHPDPLVPRSRTHGVTERIDQFGDVIMPALRA